MVIIGAVYGKLTVLKYMGRNKKSVPFVSCICICGEIINRNFYGLKKSNHASCGCSRVHGMMEYPEYNSWLGMKQRAKYKKYWGKRGIKVCDKWLGRHGFSAFYKDMGPKPTLKHSIDRIDNNGNYEPGNCRWATYKEQANNTRANIFIEYNDEKLTVMQWAERINVHHATLRKRIKNGWPIAMALSSNVRRW